MNIDVSLGRTKAMGGLMGCAFLCTYFPLPPDGLKAVAPREANALGVEGGFSEVTVICLIIGLYVEVAFLVHTPFYFKVTNEARVVGHSVVAIAGARQRGDLQADLPHQDRSNLSRLSSAMNQSSSCYRGQSRC